PRDDKLFSLNFICQRDAIKTREFAGIQLTVLPSKSQGALYDLNVFLVQRTDGWRLSCEYKTDLFEEGTVSRLLDNFESVLQQIVRNPSQKTSEFIGLKPRVTHEEPRSVDCDARASSREVVTDDANTSETEQTEEGDTQPAGASDPAETY